MAGISQVDREKLIEIAMRHQISYPGLFGSYARGAAQEGSDIDLYVRFGRHVRLFEMLGMKHEMEDALGLPVDLIVEEAVIPHQFVREGMAKDLTDLYQSESVEHVPAQRS